MAIVTLVTCRELYDEFRDLQIVFHTKCKAPLRRHSVPAVLA
eukprot:CAMPEP_0194782294 /NCGR_PEP_ID=MMETSP0323_2-20130528/78609_1 /TAXON_ID=2866 ORGANISM="Crypthecodinium cohnii, Strain Seligo" /NCGR_SAMPLE_ID=MMETSP0323_2 /ASSEMBLY_ACC=CAM_ASM_000346 /LENGTH=41 /DNA_ID= /DNA_START= /DNA_END= /DNA_ORIENTATION=